MMGRSRTIQLLQLQAALVMLAQRHPDLPEVVVIHADPIRPIKLHGSRPEYIVIDDMAPRTSAETAKLVHHLKLESEAPQAVSCSIARRSKGDKHRLRRERWSS